MLFKRSKPVIVALMFAFLLLSGCKSNGKAEQGPNTPQQLIGQKEHNRGSMVDTLGITRDSLMANIKRQQAKEQAKANQKLVAEAMVAIQETQHALEALDKGKKDEALKSMETVLGKLELLLERNPDLALVPIDAHSQVVNLIGDLKQIETLRKKVKELIDKGYLQDARRLLDNMVSEIRVTTSYIPLKTYPEAIKLAARLVDQNKIKKAKVVLANALSAIVIKEISIPIPVINAQAMIDLAADSVSTHPKKALELLKEAQYQIQVAEALGYGNRDKEFKNILDDIEAIKNKIKHKEETGGLFDSLKDRLEKFKERISK